MTWCPFCCLLEVLDKCWGWRKFGTPGDQLESRKSGPCFSSHHTSFLVVQGREVEDGDLFHFNEGFSAALYRIKINSIQMKESVEENKKTNDEVMQDRQYQVCSTQNVLALFFHLIIQSETKVIVVDIVLPLIAEVALAQGLKCCMRADRCGHSEGDEDTQDSQPQAAGERVDATTQIRYEGVRPEEAHRVPY